MMCDCSHGQQNGKRSTVHAKKRMWRKRSAAPEATLPSDQPLTGDGSLQVAEAPAADADRVPVESPVQTMTEAIEESNRRAENRQEDRPADQEPRRATDALKSRRRPWASRTTEPVYKMFEDVDQTKKLHYIFQFTLPKNPATGKEEMPPALLEIIHKHKKDENG